MLAPQLGDRLGVHQLEDALFSVGPLDETRTGVGVLEQLQQELPEVGGVTWPRRWNRSDLETSIHLDD